MTVQDYIDAYREAVTPGERGLAVFRIHMARMWPERHDGKAHSRKSIRDNLRGQRHCKAAIAREKGAA